MSDSSYSKPEFWEDLPTSCHLCHEDLTGEGEKLVVLPCGHAFGSACLEKWRTTDARHTNHCPLCRFKLFYRKCKHFVEARDAVLRKKATITEDELPERCRTCWMKRVKVGSRYEETKNLKAKLERLSNQYADGPAEPSFIPTGQVLLADFIEQLSQKLESTKPLFEEQWKRMWIDRARDFW